MTSYVSPPVDLIHDFIAALEAHRAVMRQCQAAVESNDSKQAADLLALANQLNEEASALSEELTASASGRWVQLSRADLM